jgi:integrase
MVLTDAKARAAKPRKDGKQYKLTDGHSMYLLVKPAGKYWKLDYTYQKKRRTLSLGVYPTVTLKEARKAAEEARELLRHGVDPFQQRRAERLTKEAQHNGNTFEGVALELLEKKAATLSPSTIESNRHNLQRHVFPWLGSALLEDVTAPAVLSLLRRIESRGAMETAHKVRGLCGQVMRYGVATGRITSNPIRDLAGAIAAVKVTHRPAITDPVRVGELMRAIDGFKGTLVVQCALKLSPLVFLRPGELRQLRWEWVNIDEQEIRLPADIMKMRQRHIVPLSKQALQILEEIRPLTLAGCYVFPSVRGHLRPMSENTINATLRRLGFDKSEMCAHGFRGMASTLLHEQGYPSDWIERQLAHKEGNAIKAAYNHARHLSERRKMMQAWADYLDAVKHGADVVPIRSNG